MLVKLTELDGYLKERDLIRKHVAKDRSCLFRCFAEVIYMSQLFHSKVKSQLEEYLLKHCPDLERIDDVRREDYCGTLEDVQLLCNIFEMDAAIYDEDFKEPTTIRAEVAPCEQKDRSEIMLAHDSYFRQFDLVLTTKYMQLLAFAQSMVYKTVYRVVLRCTESAIDDNVQKMLQEKYYSKKKAQMRRMKPEESREKIDVEEPPFSYKTAKCLSPEFYRNEQFDLWLTKNKDVFMEVMSTARIQLGSKCRIPEEEGIGYVQKIEKDRKAVLFSFKAGVNKPYEFDEIVVEEQEVAKRRKKLLRRPKKVDVPAGRSSNENSAAAADRANDYSHFENTYYGENTSLPEISPQPPTLTPPLTQTPVLSYPAAAAAPYMSELATFNCYDCTRNIMPLFRYFAAWYYYYYHTPYWNNP